jgi:hypothetical protein
MFSSSLYNKNKAHGQFQRLPQLTTISLGHQRVKGAAQSQRLTYRAALQLSWNRCILKMQGQEEVVHHKLVLTFGIGHRRNDFASYSHVTPL